MKKGRIEKFLNAIVNMEVECRKHVQTKDLAGLQIWCSGMICFAKESPCIVLKSI